MKIVMVVWSFYPRVGGSLTCVRELSEQLLARGTEVEIIAPILKRDLDKKEGLDLDKRIKIHWVVSSAAASYTDFYSRFVFFLKYIEKIRSLSVSADIFHAHDFNVSFLSAMIGTKKPIVATFGADPLFEML
ncbi:MAG: glycosyltransferase, partial [Candidatus Omnitrophica bacterium]|nr:glycosyltransferase [Candidatus Omnitrophota bacterium]